MKISVFGMGYVGAVCAACFAKEGHQVTGVDPNRVKVDLVNSGKSPIIEEGLAQLIGAAVKGGTLRGTTSAEEAVVGSEISFVCVGTPSENNGSLDLRYVRRVCEQIGSAISRKDDYHIIVIRSTVLPGTIRDVVIPTLEEKSAKKAGLGFGVASNPEFLRESTAIFDFYHPPKTVIGESDTRTGEILASLYEHLDAPLLRIDLETAEMVKYADNAWHATKVSFANEIGNICKAVGVDGHKVMEVFCHDTKLNLSPYYLKPGFAFGGSCLPKDVRALSYKGRSLDLDLPLLESLLISNQKQLERAIHMVTSKGYKKLGILGLSFKAGTDDVRESPMVELVERLLGKGFEIKIYDKNVELASLVGANRDYILNRIPHISKLIVSNINDVMEYAETVVIGNASPEFKKAIGRGNNVKAIVDLVRISEGELSDGYDGICW